LGLGAHQESRLKADTLNGRTVTHSIASNLGAGPMLGYQFTAIGVIAEWSRNIRARNDVAGDFVNVRFVVRF
jgi:hypothetical protein